MRITKFVHSCLMVEDNGRVFLIDPGNYTFEENALNIHAIPRLDYLLITHDHPDHMYLPLVKILLEKFPAVQVISNNQVKKILAKEGLSVNTTGNDQITMIKAKHEDALFSPLPVNVLFRVASILTHPGDSFHFSLETPILALPISAPWGSTVDAVKMAIKLHPKIIIPIHDWHLNDKARKSLYDRLTDIFREKDIDFKKVSTGEKIDV